MAPRRSLRTAVAAALVLALGCGGADDPSPAAPPDCAPRAPGDPAAQGVSFRAAILPLFAGSCSLERYCHADRASPQGGLYLGPNPTDADYPPDDATIAAVLDALVNAPSQRAVSMPRVTPGAPAESFLMHKIDADQGCSGILCEDPLTGDQGEAACGDKMPPNNAEPLPAAEADLVRAWILEGAGDN